MLRFLLAFVFFSPIAFAMQDIAPSVQEPGLKHITAVNLKDVDAYVKANPTVKCYHIETVTTTTLPLDVFECTDGKVFKTVQL